MINFDSAPFRLEFRNKNTDGEWHVVVQSQSIEMIFSGIEQRIHNFADNQYRVMLDRLQLWESGHTVVMDTGLFNYKKE